jgi:predicted glycogen debranching enzyme
MQPSGHESVESVVPVMTPGPGQHARRFVGDRMLFTMRAGAGPRLGKGWRALLRTNLGRADTLRAEILHAHAKGVPFAGTSWRDIPMQPTSDGWVLDLALSETGYFKAKAYLLDPKGWQHWPQGQDFGLSVHPDCYRTGNAIYCAFPRMFGAQLRPKDPHTAPILKKLDSDGYAVIPPSGKLRDLTRALPHIIERLRCRILHLLPVNPVPTTYARFGTFGSPYAALDLAAVDPGLVEFDKRTTGADQFSELTYAAHLRGARVVLDIVVNHTGWGSIFQENHPEWFLRQPDGMFKSPGAWGVTWEDLVELNHTNPALWDALSEVFLTWCRRGVDGFRCDAGYMVPMPAWQYIIARVQQEFPDTLFLLEGLGGAWEATEALLTEGGMQWAYSELFQNYVSPDLPRYISHSIEKSRDIGVLVHYSETHDNNRLALRGKAWSLMRNRLCALASDNGAFGFTCGVEWLATEKILVHGNTSMNWGARDNIVEELARLNELLANHPCFFDGARVERLSPVESPVLALLRTSDSAAGLSGTAENAALKLLVLINTDTERSQTLELTGASAIEELRFDSATDLLGQPMPSISVSLNGFKITLAPGAVHCLGADVSVGTGDAYRAARARAALAVKALSHRLPIESIGAMPWQELAKLVDRGPARFLGTVPLLEPDTAQESLPKALEQAGPAYLPVVHWSLDDSKRITLVPPDHWILLENPRPFRACLVGGTHPLNLESTPASGGQIAVIPPGREPGDASLQIETYADRRIQTTAALRFLPATPELAKVERAPCADDLILLTNGRGGMARIPIDLGRINSKYDCALAANLHPDFPVDRHVLAKRVRAWVNADGFLSPLNASTLAAVETGTSAVWHFVAPAGDGRSVQVDIEAAMLSDRNTTVFRFSRPTAADAVGKQLPPECDVRLTVRVDIEDRNFHQETIRSPGAEHHFRSHIAHFKPAGSSETGFSFTPAGDRRLVVFADRGAFHSQEEWSHLSHPLEASRGQPGHGDSFSPGWFEIPLAKGSSTILTLCADPEPPSRSQTMTALARAGANAGSTDPFAHALASAARAFVARRGEHKTIIAGYPWFLDWGRDTFIAARGLISAGYVKEVLAIVRLFAQFELSGTLPNTIHGEDASNRDTSDAPLWMAVVCEDLLQAATDGLGRDLLSAPVKANGRTLREVLESIAANYIAGTPNGIRVDPSSALVWSPSHFTWMDTNYPAGTPREGYPIEIQALWIRMLRFLADHGSSDRRAEWADLASRAASSVERLFWIAEKGWYSDVLLTPAGKPAHEAVQDDALRSNACFLVSLGISSGERARSTVAATARHLVVPGALRSLAPLSVRVPLPIRNAAGNLLNDPHAPYRGRYLGDEDTSRKPAYHNGTAWVWTFPSFCEALARAWDFDPVAVAAAKSYLASTEALLQAGCIGQLPEILDGDVPHAQRGCDAQAWSVTETLRVWLLLKTKENA